jgi:hypothetical protein
MNLRPYTDRNFASRILLRNGYNRGQIGPTALLSLFGCFATSARITPEITLSASSSDGFIKALLPALPRLVQAGNPVILGPHRVELPGCSYTLYFSYQHALYRLRSLRGMTGRHALLPIGLILFRKHPAPLLQHSHNVPAQRLGRACGSTLP